MVWPSNPSDETIPAVSGLVCGCFLSFVKDHGGSTAELTAGLQASEARLHEWYAWFPWETYLQLEERFGQAMAHLEDPYLALGRYVITKNGMGPASVVLRTLATPVHPYRLVPWMVPSFLLHGTTVDVHEPSEDLVVMEYHFPPHIEPTAPFLEIIRGQLITGPVLVGLPPAEVTLTRHDRQVSRFEVRLPRSVRVRGGGVLGWLGRRVGALGRRSLVLLDLGGELLRTNELLARKLRELEDANQRLQAEAGERLRAVAAVRASEERYRALAESAEELIVVLDEALHVEYVNPWGATLTGLDSAALRGRSLGDFLPTERLLRIQQIVAQVLRSGLPSISEGSLGEGKDERIFEASWVPLRNGESQADTVLCVARDVTARRRAEREKELLDARLQHTQKMESLGVLVGGVAHDFNNLLTVVRGNAELVGQRLPGDHPVQGLLGPIAQAACQGAELCRLMLAFAGKGAQRQSRVDLSSTVRRMESLLRASFPESAELRFQLEEGLPPVLGDRTQLRQLAMNLVMNGAESLPGGAGRVTLATGIFEPTEADLESAVVVPPVPWALRYVFLEVTDTGCGMDAQTRARAFEPFYTTKFPGRGLGLAAVLGMVRGHSGLLMVESTPSQGTRIRVGFPQTTGEEEVSTDWDTDPAEEPSPARAEGDAEAQEPLSLPWAGGGRVPGPVLLVDDEREIRELGRTILEELGLQVLTAADGREALEYFEDGGPRVAAVILDITMPNMDGETLLRALRKRAPGLPVLLISGHAAQEVASRFESLEPYAYLPKPFSIAALVRVLGELLAGGSSAASSAIPLARPSTGPQAGG